MKTTLHITTSVEIEEGIFNVEFNAVNCHLEGTGEDTSAVFEIEGLSIEEEANSEVIEKITEEIINDTSVEETVFTFIADQIGAERVE